MKRNALPNLTLLASILFLTVLVLLYSLPVRAADIYYFTEADKNFLSSFSISQLPPLPQSHSNQYADNPKAAKLGHHLFFDSRFSANGRISCASCHQPEKYFTDGLAQSQGLGQTRRSAPSVLGSAYGPWKFWDGRKDSLWSQALAPLENPLEHGISRTETALLVVKHYSQSYQEVFGSWDMGETLSQVPLPASPIGDKRAQEHWDKLSARQQQLVNRIFVNVGKALMAYERQLRISPSRFDVFIDALLKPEMSTRKLQSYYSKEEVQGLRLFMGKAGCASCHNGPLFTNFEFHNVGAPEPDENNVDLGRYSGIQALANDEFTCLSNWSDAKSEQCEEMRYLKTTGPELVGALKTPSLRNIAHTAPYMQSGQLASLQAVIEHYNKPTPPFYNSDQHPSRPHFDILPLQLSAEEQTQLIAFLHSLSSPIPQENPWWSPPQKSTPQ